jgi:hypothetical protein
MPNFTPVLNALIWTSIRQDIENCAPVSRAQITEYTKFDLVRHTRPVVMLLYIPPIVAGVLGFLFHFPIICCIGVSSLLFFCICQDLTFRIILYLLPFKRVLPYLTVEYQELLFWRFLIHEDKNIQYLVPSQLERYSRLSFLVEVQLMHLGISVQFGEFITNCIGNSGAVEVQTKQTLIPITF